MNRKRIFILFVDWLMVGTIGIAFFVSAVYGQADTSSDLRIVKSKQGYTFFEGPQKIMDYQQQYKSLTGKYRRCNYIHPLYGLDGEVLTEDFPADHLHHRGIFWAWHQLWLGGEKVGDNWSLQNCEWENQSLKVIQEKNLPPALQINLFWKSPLYLDKQKKPKPLVRETTFLRVWPADKEKRFIDFQISLLALHENMRLGGSEDVKGYGGFSTRIRLPKELEFIGAVGPVTPRNTAVNGGAWMDFSGHFLNQRHISGLAVLVHKSNPGYPQRWTLRRQGSAQNAVYPGRHPVALSTKNPLVLRYRLVIHRGNSKHVNLDTLQKQYNIIKLHSNN